MLSLGIMQGRLTPSKGRGIQFFPFENWRNEFVVGSEIGINEIEWIFDYDNFNNNPLWSTEGCLKINKIIESTGVCVRSVCLDYFMRRPFFKYTGSDYYHLRDENKAIFQGVLEHMVKIGAKLLEIPLVDASSIKSSKEENNIKEFIEWTCDEAANRNLEIGIESDYPPETFAPFLNNIGCWNLCANYDSGNSSGLGYDHQLEISNLGHLLGNVHIKDRILGNGSVSLGTGNANFDSVFRTLKEIGYNKSIILQAARSEDGTESENIVKQLDFVRSYLERYGVE